MNFKDIEDAFRFVSSAPKFEHTAVISKETRDIYYISEFGESDEPPDDLETKPDNYIFIPHKTDLGLGRKLVLEFASLHMKDNLDKVNAICKERGVFGRFKKLLQKYSLMEKWQEYEAEKQNSALLEWCRKQDIILAE